MRRHPDELLDVVDENNIVVGQATRQEIHDQKRLHRSVHLILTTGEGAFLLQQRSDNAPTYPGRWDSSVSGHVSAGHSLDKTVLREAHEEIGYRPSDPAPVLLLEGLPETDFEWVTFYAERVESRPPLRPDHRELKGLRWWPADALAEELGRHPDLFTPVFRLLFPLWQRTGFFVPEAQKGGWYHVDFGNAHRLEVRRAFLEASGFPARVAEDQHWMAPQGGRVLFGGRREARHTVLCVPRDCLVDAIGLLHLSEPMDEEGNT